MQILNNCVANVLVTNENDIKYLPGMLDSIMPKVKDIIFGVDFSVINDDTIRRFSKMYSASDVADIKSIGDKRNLLLERSERDGYDYVLIIDPDERLATYTDLGKLTTAMTLLDSEGCMMRQVNYDRYRKTVSNNPLIRLARPHLRYSYDFHEIIRQRFVKNLVNSGTIYHLGYDLSEEELLLKAHRNRLVLKELLNNAGTEEEIEHYSSHLKRTLTYLLELRSLR